MEMSDAVSARVYEIIGQLCPEGQRTVRATDQIVDDLGYHSVKLVELTIELEAEFNLPPIDDRTVTGCQTAGDLATLITKMLEPQHT